MSENLKVSIVIPTFNRENTIIRSVDSILSQTYSNIEVVIIDDCSTDETEKIINKNYRNNSQIIYYKLPVNSGACVARNKGVLLSTGDIIGFLDSDDTFKSEKIELQLKCLIETNSMLCASAYLRTSKSGITKLVEVFSGSKQEILDELMFCNFITTGTLIGYKECFLECPFDESLPRYQDWDVVLRLCKKYSISFVKQPLLNQFFQPASITASTGPMKSLIALDKIYFKHFAEYEKNPRAFKQIHWLMGVNSTLTRNNVRYSDLWIGATKYGISFKRLILFVISRLRMYNLFNKLYNSAI